MDLTPDEIFIAMVNRLPTMCRRVVYGNGNGVENVDLYAELRPLFDAAYQAGQAAQVQRCVLCYPGTRADRRARDCGCAS